MNSESDLIHNFNEMLKKATDITGKKLTEEKKSKLIKEFLEYNHWEKIYFIYHCYQKNTYGTFEYCKDMLTHSEKMLCKLIDSTDKTELKKIIKDFPELIKIKHKKIKNNKK